MTGIKKHIEKNALSHPQKRKSSLGTIRKGMKMGPTSTNTAYGDIAESDHGND